MAPGQAGWDWFSLQLADGWEVMLYLLRHKDGTVDPASSGSLIDPQGSTRHLKLGRLYGQAHRRLDLPPRPDQVSGGLGDHYSRGRLPSHAYAHGGRPGDAGRGPGRVSYWEGQVKIEGGKDGAPVTGLGYVELTGYAGGLGGQVLKRGKKAKREKGKRFGGIKFSCINYKVPKRSLG